MTALLYYSISSTLTEYEIIEVDRRVAKDREAVYIFVRNFAANGKDGTKRIILIIALANLVWFSNLESANAIGLSLPPSQIVRVHKPSYDYRSEIKIAKIVSPKLDKITFIKSRELPICIYMMDERFLKMSETSKLIKKLRGGGFIEAAAALVVIVIMWQILGGRIEGFVLNNPNPGWGVDRPNPFQPPGGHLRYPPVYDFFSPRRTPDCPRPGSTLQINRPTAMPHEEFVGLTKEERRALPHSNDMTIIHEGHPELEVGFWQSKFKVVDHGAIHDLPYTVKANGGTKTEKSDDNALKMMRSIVDIPNRGNVQWFEDGTYQGETDRGFEAIHIYDLDKQIIAVFKKSTGKFVTTCKLTAEEDAELKATGNFGGGQVKNLPPHQTAVNTFESDVTGMTPISPMNENSSLGFTPTSSFESDVMGITPIDKSQFDNP
jgi:hypothetical protein